MANNNASTYHGHSMSMQNVLATISLLFIATMPVHSRGDMAPQVLFQKLEDALKTNKQTLYLLRKAFFPTQSLPRDLVNLDVHVTVCSVLPEKCDEHCAASGAISNFSYTQKFQWSSSPLLDLIPSGQLLTLDNVLSRVIYRATFHRSRLSVELQIDSFPIGATKKDLLEALIQLLCWVKTYIPVHGKPDASDKGYVSTRYTESRYAWMFRLNVLLGFVFLNILTPIVLAKSFSQYYSRIRANVSAEDFTKCLYQATGFASFLCNVAYTTFSIWNYFSENDAIAACAIHLSKHPCTIPSDTSAYREEVNTLLAKLIIIPFAIFAELLMSIYIVRRHFVIMVRTYDQRYYPLKVYLLQSLHVLALWNNMITIQLATMTAIPLTVLLLTHPQVTMFYLIYFLMPFVSLTIIVAYVLYWCQQCRRRRGCCNVRYCGRIFVQFVVIVAILGLIITLLALYELMLLVQAHIETGVKGILLALLPSFPLPALGWYLKRRSQRRAAADADEEHVELITEQRQPSNVVENDDSKFDERPLPL